eukprot:CAMPEP_0173344768 /NCGR_PEP_ID=MMETSP1144-20121109/11591_1 /TAXON_ID=483371 /ORGANISM="non described non described, Strain CCMP2298" /LENGTH=147 /DNA_ID=CAMNT_0014291799 /DNA_START=105 /DNA_END=548 /DNA_ORIENTATION=-
MKATGSRGPRGAREGRDGSLPCPEGLEGMGDRDREGGRGDPKAAASALSNVAPASLSRCVPCARLRGPSSSPCNRAAVAPAPTLVAPAIVAPPAVASYRVRLKAAENTSTASAPPPAPAPWAEAGAGVIGSTQPGAACVRFRTTAGV